MPAESDLLLKLAWAQDNDAAAEQIMMQGRDFALKNLRDDSVTSYQAQVLSELAQRQAQPFERIDNSLRFGCSSIPADPRWAHWAQKCEQYQPWQLDKGDAAGNIVDRLIPAA